MEDRNLCSARANLSILPPPITSALPSPRARTTFFPSANKMHAASAAAAAAAEKDRDGDSAFLLSPQRKLSSLLLENVRRIGLAYFCAKITN